MENVERRLSTLIKWLELEYRGDILRVKDECGELLILISVIKNNFTSRGKSCIGKIRVHRFLVNQRTNILKVLKSKLEPGFL